MRNRCCKANPLKLKEEILKNNLRVSEGSSNSGSEDWVKEGIKIDGGYLVRSKGEVVAWAVAFENKEFHLFVSPHARKNGIGSKIIKRASKDFFDHKFCPWNESTLKMFKKNKVKYCKTYLPWYLI